MTISSNAINQTSGVLKLPGTSSGVVTIQPQAAAGTYNFNLPITAGTAGQPLLSGGGSSTPMTWGSPAYSAASITVSPIAGQGDYTTITAALAAATSGQDILVKAGTYTEDLILKNQVTIVSLDGVATIKGKMTDSGGSVDCFFYNVRFETNGDYGLSVSNAGAISFYNCYINMTDHTFFQMTGGLTNIFCYYCSGDSGTTGVSIFDITAGDFWSYYSNWSDSGSSTTACTLSGGQAVFSYSTSSYAISTSSTGIVDVVHSEFLTPNLTPLVLTGAQTHTVFNSRLRSDTASSVSIGSGSTAIVADNVITSSNTNVFTGAGTINTGGNVCTNSSGNNVSTINSLTVI